MLVLTLWAASAGGQGLVIDVGYGAAGAGGGPVPPLLVDEGFEGTGLPSGWTTEEGLSVPNYDATPGLVGSQCLFMEQGGSPTTGTRVQFSTVDDTIDIYFKMMFTSLPSQTVDRFVTLLNEDGSTEWAIVGLNTDGSLYCIHGGVSSFVTNPMAAGVTNHVWITYTRNTGGNSGFLSAGFSTTGIRPNSGNYTELENGVAVGYPARCRWKKNGTVQDYRIDRVLISEDPILDSP